MKIAKKITAFLFLSIICLSTYASPEVCRSELRELIIPPLDHVAMNKRDIRADIEDVSDGVYSVRLYVAADSPDNLDKQVSIGWVDLDTNSMKVLDVTRDLEHPEELKVNDAKYRKFISDCLRKPSKAASQCDELNQRASQTAISIPHSESEMMVIGNGRLQFYSAPAYSCEMKGVFILPNESVEAYTNYHEFTSVAYLNSKQSKPILGWVRSSRLAPNGLGMAPTQKPPTEPKVK